MNTSGEAAEQVVRMSLEAGEVALRISGKGAVKLAAILYAILRDQQKTKGRARLETLIRSGKPLTVFSIRESDLKTFVQEAKRYGILYSAVRDPRGSSDGMVDIMVKEEDAPRLNRIIERFRLSSVAKAVQDSPFPSRAESPSQFGPIFTGKEKNGSGFERDETAAGKHSVRKELQELKERQKKQAAESRKDHGKTDIHRNTLATGRRDVSGRLDASGKRDTFGKRDTSGRRDTPGKAGYKKRNHTKER